uniref:Uncharacterized protein n=1 Tax=Meloidogyne floridensis TaxID=298350 RepID=A0A915NZY5_9BILA
MIFISLIVFLLAAKFNEANTDCKDGEGAVTFLSNQLGNIQGIKANSYYNKTCSNKNTAKRCYPNDDSNISVFKIVCSTDICICGNVDKQCYSAKTVNPGDLDYMFYSHSGSMFVNPNVGSISLSSPDNHHFDPKTSAPKFMELTPGTKSYLNGEELSGKNFNYASQLSN